MSRSGRLAAALGTVVAIIVIAGLASAASVIVPALLGGLLLLFAVLVWSAYRRSRSTIDAESRLQRLYDEALDDSFFDSLTGVGNHRSFEVALAHQTAEYESMQTPFALALVDVDDMQVVNRREGVAEGDEVLIGVAETLQQISRPEDRVYRIGGDEFAIIMPGLDLEGAVVVMERVLHFSRRPSSGLRPNSFSCGVSAMPYLTSDGAILIRQAQKALEWVKSHGHGTVTGFDPDRDRIPGHAHDIARSAIQEVVAGKLLSSVFQPIVDLQSGRVLGFEALIRPDPRGPLPGTAQLFEAAASSGRTVELDLACIEVVLMAARAIGPDQIVTLNLSPRTLERKDFDASWLLEVLMRNGISPSRVIVELTDRDAVSDVQRLRRTFSHLQQYGLRFAADDVASGAFDQRLMSQIRFDIVKIDLARIQQGTPNAVARVELQSLRDLALSQHSTVVAEGVETAEQLQIIRELRIGAAQGYLLGRPGVSVAATFVDLARLAGGRHPGSEAEMDRPVVALPAAALWTPGPSDARTAAAISFVPSQSPMHASVV